MYIFRNLRWGFGYNLLVFTLILKYYSTPTRLRPTIDTLEGDLFRDRWEGGIRIMNMIPPSFRAVSLKNCTWQPLRSLREQRTISYLWRSNNQLRHNGKRFEGETYPGKLIHPPNPRDRGPRIQSWNCFPPCSSSLLRAIPETTCTVSIFWVGYPKSIKSCLIGKCKYVHCPHLRRKQPFEPQRFHSVFEPKHIPPHSHHGYVPVIPLDKPLDISRLRLQ